MSKRPFKSLGLGGGAHKLPKLEVTISEHNFPLSQNIQQRSAPHDAAGEDAWGDVDEELLLQASQACEQVDQHNLSTLPEYSDWIQAPSSSTQVQAQLNSSANPFSYGQSFPSTSKAACRTNNQNTSSALKENPAERAHTFYQKTHYGNAARKESFTFKKPTAIVTNTGVSIDKCNKATAPFPNVSSGVAENGMDDLFVLDDLKEDSGHLYRKLIQIQEENAKLKGENGKLREEALSRDGEVTILRGRLKCSQAAVDGARLERVRACERLQAEWAERLGDAHKQAGALQTQLDCKELEVVRAKERCRLLESNKVKLTQAAPAPGHNHTLLSQHRAGHGFSIQSEMNGAMSARGRRGLVSAAAQTRPRHFLRLNAAHRTPGDSMAGVLPLLLEPAAAERSPLARGERGDGTAGASLAAVHEDLASLVAATDWRCLDERRLRRCSSMVSHVKRFLSEAAQQLAAATRRLTSPARRDLDDAYLLEASRYTPVAWDRLPGGQTLYKEELGLAARRATSALARLCGTCAAARRCARAGGDLVSLMLRVTRLVGSLSLAVQYSGLLLSFVHLSLSLLPAGAETERADDDVYRGLSELARAVAAARPAPPVLCAALAALRALSARPPALEGFCTDSAAGNVKFDYDQGLVLYRRESCFLQVFLHQLEHCLKCMERQGLASDAVSVTQNLLSFYCNADALSIPWCQFSSETESRCKCSRQLAQVLVYALQVCSRMLSDVILNEPEDESSARMREDSSLCAELEAVCGRGAAVLYRWGAGGPELAHYEGRRHVLLERCAELRARIASHEIHGNVIAELAAALQPSAEELDTPAPAAPLQHVWIESFEHFHIAD